MFQLSYTSAAAKALNDSDLGNILERSRERNEINAITGVLLFHRGEFFQVLEGEEAVVETVFARIQRDARHRDVRVLSRVLVNDREFSAWAMRFLDTSVWKIHSGLIGYNSLPEFAAADPTMKRHLRTFHVGLSRAGLVA